MAIEHLDNFDHYRPGLRFVDSFGVYWMKLDPESDIDHLDGCVIDLETGKIKHKSNIVLPIHIVP